MVGIAIEVRKRAVGAPKKIFQFEGYHTTQTYHMYIAAQNTKALAKPDTTRVS